jgi:hypothetical protein
VTRNLRLVALVFLSLVAASFLVAARGSLGSASGPHGDKRDSKPPQSPYHKHPPKDPVPRTLEPETVKQLPAAYVAYRIAAQIPEVLYQEPCFCPCRRLEGHQSLLDCYVGTHGRKCAVCQLLAIFAFEQHKLGKSPKQIRKGMFRNKWLETDLQNYIHDYLSAERATEPVPKEEMEP